MKGKLSYIVREGGDRLRCLKLPVCECKDLDILQTRGVAGLRQERILRLMKEAQRRGVRLSYRDLSLILLSSKATIKRDIGELKKRYNLSDKGICDI